MKMMQTFFRIFYIFSDFIQKKRGVSDGKQNKKAVRPYSQRFDGGSFVPRLRCGNPDLKIKF
jgi:hypothetical protein